MSINTLSPLYSCSGGSSGLEMYTAHDNGNMDTYMMQGIEPMSRLSSPVFENFETMTTDRATGYIVDPSLYYPAASSYGYYCTGFESPGERDEQQAVFGADGSHGTDVRYMAQGAQAENMPYVYYAPNYGYGESSFNPYNPYIPGAMIGVDGSYVATQPYYVSPYSDTVSSPGYFPIMDQSGTNGVPTSSTNTITDVGPSTTHRVNTSSTKRTHSLTPASFSVNQSKATSNQTSSVKGALQIPKVYAGTTKRPMSSCPNGSGGSTSSHMSQGISTPSSLQPVGTAQPEHNQAKFSYPVGGSLSDYTSTANSQALMDDQWSKFYHRRSVNDLNGSVDPSSGPMTTLLSLRRLTRTLLLMFGISTPSSLQPVGTAQPEHNQAKFSYPVGGSLSDYTSTANSQALMDDQWSKFYHRRSVNDLNGSVDPSSEQNRGPRTNKSKNQIIVKAYTTKAGNCNSEGNIVITTDEYNKDDFLVDYARANFFVIKSYSEDDVHKSIKYNVWSSTPNGNKKLNSAYEDAQKFAAGKLRRCPIFLFFSVNASGQFCGVAEMVGPVEFDKDMDFWQQDKWSGSFPVKWHFIKDVSNPTFRHIILENNEHKPVTNSRDTQEILYKPGLEMLNVFKNYTSKTSLLDDFIYYENRQKIMCEERARFLHRANTHVHAHTIKQPIQVNSVTDRPPKDGTEAWVEKAAPYNLRAAEKTSGSTSEKMHSSTGDVDKLGGEIESTDVTSMLKMDSLCIHPKKQIEHNSATLVSSTVVSSAPRSTTAPPTNVVTVGSLPIKVDGKVNKSSGTVTIGTIALDPETLQNSKNDSILKGGPQK